MSFIRIASLAAVVLGGGYIGMLFASRLAWRAKQLEQLILIITQIGFNINFLKMPLAKALSGAASGRYGEVGQVFLSAADGIADEGMAPSAALERAVLRSRSNLCITDEDIEILMEFAKNLGLGDVKSEMNNIDAAQARLTLARSMAEGERESKSKLCKGMGLLCGMLVALILL